MLVDGHESVGRVQRQDRAARREQKDAVNEMATLDTDHGSGPGTGRHDGRNVGFLRFENAKTPPVAQVLSNFHFIVQESSLRPRAATYNEYTRMGLLFTCDSNCCPMARKRPCLCRFWPASAKI